MNSDKIYNILSTLKDIDMRRFLLSNTLNTRDLCGYPTNYGKVTKCKAFVRSDVPLQISPDDKELLLSNNITTVVDLRSDEEIQRKPCGLNGNDGFKYYHCKMHGGDRLPISVEAVPISYFEMVDEPKSILNDLCKNNKGFDINIITPKIEYIEKFLELFGEKYSTVEKYLLKIGLSTDEVIELRDKLV